MATKVRMSFGICLRILLIAIKSGVRTEKRKLIIKRFGYRLKNLKN